MRINRQNQYLAYVQPESSTVVTDIGKLPKGLSAAAVYNTISDNESSMGNETSVSTADVGYLSNLLYIATLKIKGDRVRKIAEEVKEWAATDAEITKIVLSREALGLSGEEYDKLLSNLQTDTVTNYVRVYAYE